MLDMIGANSNVAFSLLLLGVLGLYWELHVAPGMVVPGLVGAILLTFGAVLLLDSWKQITPGLAISVSLAFGVITGFLGFLGMRARRSRHLTGIETMVGTTGICKTDLNPEGTILIQGEYWKAQAKYRIPVGHRVVVENVQDLQLWVKEA